MDEPSENDDYATSAQARAAMSLAKAALAEATEARKELVDRDTPFLRRSYVRAVFAGIDAYVAAMRQMALLRPEKLSPEERLLLQERAPMIANGEASYRQQNTSLRDGLRYSFNSYMRFAGAKTTLVLDGEWENFLGAIRIRDRVTHPKSEQDFAVSDDDVKAVSRVTEWLAERTFNGLTENVPQSLVVIGLVLAVVFVFARKVQESPQK